MSASDCEAADSAIQIAFARLKCLNRPAITEQLIISFRSALVTFRLYLFVALVHGSFRRPSGQAHICDIVEEPYWQDVLLCNCIDVYISCHEAEIMKIAPYNILL